MEAVKIDQEIERNKQVQKSNKIRIKKPVIKLRDALQPPATQEPKAKQSIEASDKKKDIVRVTIPKLNLGLVRNDKGAIVT